MKTKASRCPHASHTAQDSYQIILQKEKTIRIFQASQARQVLVALFAVGKGLLCYTVQNIHHDEGPALSHKVSRFFIS